MVRDARVLHMPEDNEHLIVEASVSQRIVLDFDPRIADISRYGQDLVFQFENQGSITLINVLSESAASTLEIPGGSFCTLAEFFTMFGEGVRLREDAEKIVSGLTQPLRDIDFLHGIDRLDGLDLAWEGAAGQDRREEGGYSKRDQPGEDRLRSPGGDTPPPPSSVVLSFSSVLYEDDQPHQNIIVRDVCDQIQPGRLAFSLDSDGDSELLSVTMSGFPPGTRVWQGSPNEGGILLTPGAGGSCVFSASQLSIAGIYRDPPENDDTDIRISYRATVSTPTGVQELDGTFTIVVDAVADKPGELVLDPGEAFISGLLHVSQTGTDERHDSGWVERDLIKAATNTDNSAVVAGRMPIPECRRPLPVRPRSRLRRWRMRLTTWRFFRRNQRHNPGHDHAGGHV